MEETRLNRQIQGGSCVLFLGAGASVSSGGPTAEQLADELAQHFFSDTSKRFTLGHVCEYVESNFSRKDLEDHLTSRLGSLSPQGALLEIPKYQWHAIFTVNFDTLLETAYEATASAVQKLFIAFSDKDNISNVPPGCVPVYKLHGCISRCRTDEGRLTLTTDDYAHATRIRRRLFNRLADSLADSTILYAGFGRDDQDFRTILQNLKEAFIHPEDQRRTYALFPGYQEIDSRRWEREKVTLIDADCDRFFQHLSETIPESERVVTTAGFIKGESPDILGRLHPTANEIIGTLQQNFDFVDSRMSNHEANTDDFFKGATPTWGTIARKIPAERDIEDDIVQRVLVDDALDHPKPYFCLITAEAGSGKSTLLRSIAAELFQTWDREVLFLQPNGMLDFLTLERFIQLVGRRVYVCIDNATTRAREIADALSNAGRSGLKLSIIATARTNEWEDVAEGLYFPSESRFELGLLSRAEIDRILKTLEQTGNLGLLAGLSYEAQVHSFESLAQKQLLVALREATEGEQFDKIVLDEFDKIPSETAKKAYLAVCSLHWLGIAMRVGLLRRLTGISFTEFQESVFIPAKKVIIPYDSLDIKDTVYGARHSVIARIVFWGKVPSENARLDFYRRVLSSLDLGYEADRAAFRQMTRARSKEIMECFTTYDTKQQFFILATEVDPNDAYIHQHRAMMALKEKETVDALDYIGEARRLHPNDLTIRDTHARILIVRGLEQPWVTARTAFAEAENILNANIAKWPTNSYGYATLSELYQALAQKSDDPEEQTSYLSKAYDMVLKGIERCKTRTMLWQLQGQLEQAVGTLEGARDAFRKVLKERPSDVVTRLLFAKLEESEGEVDVALNLLRDGLASAGNDRRLRHQLGIMLLKHQPSQTTEIETHLKAAVMIPGNDYMPRFHLACFLFQTGDYPGAYQNFEVLNEIDIPRAEANQVRWIIRDEAGNPKNFTGQIANLGYDYGFIKSEFPRDMYFNRWALPAEDRDQIRLNTSVRFRVGFNVRGPVAMNVQSASKQ
jgi:tetratricopeptide (TPR) repeat protein